MIRPHRPPTIDAGCRPAGRLRPSRHRAPRHRAPSWARAPLRVALAWLLQRSPNILLIPGISSVGHLRENLTAGAIELPSDALAELDRIGGAGAP